MKKLLTGIFALAISFCVVGCGNSGVSCTVEKLDGEKVTMSSSKIVDIAETDSITFDKEYSRAAITGQGKITEIEKGTIGSYTAGNTYYVVTINNAVRVETRAEVFVDFKVGDSVKFNGVIYKGFIYLDVDQASDSNSDPQQNIFHIN